MPNGNFVNQELNFEKHISDMKDRDLLEFVARQNFVTCIRCDKHNKRITDLENQSKKISGITGGISGTITAIIIGIIGHFTKGN